MWGSDNDAESCPASRSVDGVRPVEMSRFPLRAPVTAGPDPARYRGDGHQDRFQVAKTGIQSGNAT